MPEYCHLHCHTQYSLLDGQSDIGLMMDKAVRDGQKGIALTDHGNMFGAFKFVAEANKRGIKPVIGCEFYLVEDRFRKTFSRARGERDDRYHQLLLAKNTVGYQNLTKLCSLGFIEGLYSKFPRIDKSLIEKYHEGLVATSCCIGAEIPQTLLRGRLSKEAIEDAEKKLKWWLNIFGDDFYIELQRHRGLENIDITVNGKKQFSGVSQEAINQQLLVFAKKYDLKVICTNDSHYVEEEDWTAHDILLCINTGNVVQEENRFKFPSSDFYFKTQNEMANLFIDVPASLDNTMEILDKIEPITLERDVLLPAYPLPEGFANQNDFLRHLTFEGAKKRYGTITAEIEERLNFELDVIRNSGYPGYFLIVQDFTTTARKMGVSVGPGRGSAAGSAVAYCIGITNVDPISYDLLFERFLNPERISMPDIDIDFDDEGRQKVIDYVVDKYGQNQVAQIITYGSMKAKMALRDVGRVLDVPLSEVDKIAKTFPDHLKASLAKVLSEGDVDPKLKDNLNSDELHKAYEFRKLAEGDSPIARMIQTAKRLEGSVRNTGIHACGVVITPDDITNYVPVSVAKDNDLYVSQFDNSVAEEAGLLKMDFLGLKTLTIIKDAVKIVKYVYGVELDIEEVPLDDPETYKLFQRGETIGIFQYESAGMQKYMKELQPTQFRDLIAMNALYRPGPLEYIPNFVARRHGREAITYDLPDMEEYLKETYGITVYQEQVMLLSQKLANFTKGQADMLRKGMGKKKKKIIDALYPKFIEGGESNGHPKKTLDKIWKDWEAFASYAFNKSHSTCYAFVAFQTAYLKANYPEAFMAAVLSHNMSDIKKVNFFLSECSRMGIKVRLPNINESRVKFTVNKNKEIVFALSAIKGVGGAAVDELVRERDKNGPFSSIFDLTKRVNLRTVNKRNLENMAKAGALDSFEVKRAQYFHEPSADSGNLIDRAVKFGNQYQNSLQTASTSLFGMALMDDIPEPPIPECEEWPLIERLNYERETIGMFISGHPLDDFKLEIDSFANTSFDNLPKKKNKDVSIACMIVTAEHRVSKNGKPFGKFILEDYTGNHELMLFNDDYLKYKFYLDTGKRVLIKAKYETRWRNSDQYDLKLYVVKPLAAVAEDHAVAVQLQIDASKISHPMVREIENLCQRNPGKLSVKIQVYDRHKKNNLVFESKKYKLGYDKTVFKSLQKMKGVRCKLV